MDLCIGTTLKDMSKDKIPFETKLNIMYQVAKGVQSLHAHKIMHRDLKPDNIMVFF